MENFEWDGIFIEMPRKFRPFFSPFVECVLRSIEECGSLIYHCDFVSLSARLADFFVARKRVRE